MPEAVEVEAPESPKATFPSHLDKLGAPWRNVDRSDLFEKLIEIEKM